MMCTSNCNTLSQGVPFKNSALLMRGFLSYCRSRPRLTTSDTKSVLFVAEGVMRGPGNKVVATVSGTLSAGSLFLGYWLVRRFRRRVHQSRLLRKGPITRPAAASLALGEYVRLRSTVSAGTRRLKSPIMGVSCVAYRVNTVRVVDSRSAIKKGSVTGIWGILGGLSSVMPKLFSVSSTAEVEKEKWDTVYQVITTRGETVEIYLDEPESIANLEDVAHAGEGTRRPRVRLDVAGAEFFTMEEVSSEFQADRSSSTPSSRTQLGYKTTEEVLAIGARVTVLGEVGPDPEGAEGDVLVRKASPGSILDLKTSSISRPFVVSTKTDQGLLEDIENSGRMFFWLAIPTIAVGLSFAYLTVVKVLAVTNGPEGTETVAGRPARAPARGSVGWGRKWGRRLGIL